MNKKMKRGLIAGAATVIIGPTVFLIPKIINEVQGSYEVYIDDKNVGTVDISDTIYGILLEKGYHYNIDGRIVSAYDFSRVSNDLGITIDDDVNFRAGPGKNYEVMDVLPKNATFSLIAKTDNNWYLAQYEDRFGFLSEDFVNEIDNEEIQKQAESLPGLVTVVRANEDVNIRAGAEENSISYGILEEGEFLPFIDRTANGWYKVEYEGKIAYVSREYSSLKRVIGGEISSVAVLNEDTVLYHDPFGQEVISLPEYEVAHIYGEIGPYYYVDCDGATGYIFKDSCDRLDGSYVVVDISDQTVELYRDQKRILKTPCITGKDSTPSHIGLFYVNDKETDKPLVGEDYDCIVEHWVGYNEYGEGIHTALWREPYEYAIDGYYHESGSHGCINVDDGMPTIYDELELNDKVLVKK